MFFCGRKSEGFPCVNFLEGNLHKSQEQSSSKLFQVAPVSKSPPIIFCQPMFLSNMWKALFEKVACVHIGVHCWQEGSRCEVVTTVKSKDQIGNLGNFFRFPNSNELLKWIRSNCWDSGFLNYSNITCQTKEISFVEKISGFSFVFSVSNNSLATTRVTSLMCVHVQGLMCTFQLQIFFCVCEGGERHTYLYVYICTSTHMHTYPYTCAHTCTRNPRYTLNLNSRPMTKHPIPLPKGGGLGSRPTKMYGERLGDGVEYHLMSPTPRR